MKFLKNIHGLIKIVILCSVLWSLPSFILAYFNSTISSLTTYGTFGLILVFYIITNDRGKIIPVFIILGLGYYFISGLNYTGSDEIKYYYYEIIKYLIIIIGGTVVIRKSTLKELYIILLFGAGSCILNAVFFPYHNANFYPTYGRFSGFYLNPNIAGTICLIGFALSFGIAEKWWKYFGQIIFTIAGFVTLSRYFISIWLLMNLLSIIIDKRYVIVPILGTLFLLFIFTFPNALPLKADRFLAYKSIFSGDQVDVKTLGNDSRTDTWATYTDIIFDKPFLGNGYQKLQGRHFGLHAGVHNTYLMVLGESGIFPFLILVSLYIFIIKKAFQKFKIEPHHFFLGIVLFTALLVSHNYFDKYFILFLSLYLFIILTNEKPATKIN